MAKFFPIVFLFCLAATPVAAQTPRDLTGIVTAVPSGDEIEVNGM
jgi:hypothetical protein